MEEAVAKQDKTIKEEEAKHREEVMEEAEKENAARIVEESERKTEEISHALAKNTPVTEDSMVIHQFWRPSTVRAKFPIHHSLSGPQRTPRSLFSHS